MRYFTLEYNVNEMIEVTRGSYYQMVQSFDRETHTVDPSHLIEYHQINRNDDIVKVLESGQIESVIHQDSERDLIIMS